jgi:hypothetical protein
MWREENDIDQYGDVSTEQTQLRNVGLRPQQDIDVSTEIAEPPPAQGGEDGLGDIAGIGGGLDDAGAGLGDAGTMPS